MAATPTDATKPREGAPQRSDAAHKGIDVKTSYAGVGSGPGSISGVVCANGGTRPIISIADISEALADPAARLWIDAADAPEADISEIAQLLGLHPLVAEDIVERNQRAKVEFI